LLRKIIRSNILSAIVSISLLSLNALALENVYATTVAGATTTITSKTIPMYEITTRGIYNKLWQGVNGSGYGGKLSDIKDLNITCPTEVAIIVHGWYLNETQAKEGFDRVKLSLENNSYYIPIIGFSWSSDTPWISAKFVAKENGPKLADFILDLMNSCKEFNKDVKIRLIGHSLGARVILSSLDSLHKDPLWKSKGFKIASVHLMGAAVDNEEVSKNPQDILSDQTNWGTVKSDYGEAIEEEAVKFYNLYNSKDKVLGPNSVNPFSPYQIYPSFEGDLALGQNGSQTSPKISLPTKNYVDINVTKEIPFDNDADGNGNCDDTRILTLRPFTTLCMITGAGDSHYGYFGFRNTNATDNTKIKYNGAINVVVDNWLNDS
jgi:pimeloyl-ACP methyl ester carboxylesterase